MSDIYFLQKYTNCRPNGEVIESSDLRMNISEFNNEMAEISISMGSKLIEKIFLYASSHRNIQPLFKMKDRNMLVKISMKGFNSPKCIDGFRIRFRDDHSIERFTNLLQRFNHYSSSQNGSDDKPTTQESDASTRSMRESVFSQSTEMMSDSQTSLNWDTFSQHTDSSYFSQSQSSASLQWSSPARYADQFSPSPASQWNSPLHQTDHFSQSQPSVSQQWNSPARQADSFPHSQPISRPCERLPQSLQKETNNSSTLSWNERIKSWIPNFNSGPSDSRIPPNNLNFSKPTSFYQSGSLSPSNNVFYETQTRFTGSAQTSSPSHGFDKSLQSQEVPPWTSSYEKPIPSFKDTTKNICTATTTRTDFNEQLNKITGVAPPKSATANNDFSSSPKTYNISQGKLYGNEKVDVSCSARRDLAGRLRDQTRKVDTRESSTQTDEKGGLGISDVLRNGPDFGKFISGLIHDFEFVECVKEMRSVLKSFSEKDFSTLQMSSQPKVCSETHQRPKLLKNALESLMDDGKSTKASLNGHHEERSSTRATLDRSASQKNDDRSLRRMRYEERRQNLMKSVDGKPNLSNETQVDIPVERKKRGRKSKTEALRQFP